MDSELRSPPVSKKMLWAGRIVSVLPVALLTMSGVMKFMLPPEAAEGFQKMGYDISIAPALAVVELGSTLLYIIPQTAMLGAILLTGYLGGATATHVRVGDPFIMPVIVGVLVWLGLFLRDRRIRELIPLRRKAD